jgi:hypothetical protein
MLKPKFLATGVGSMPFTDPDRAVELSLTRFPEAPFWPQLPKLGLNDGNSILGRDALYKNRSRQGTHVF